MPRLNEEDISRITSRSGYGIVASGGGIKGTLRAGLALAKAGGAGEIDDVESDSQHAQVGSEELQIGCSGRVVVRITFYRRRLADYGEDCSRAISEKALIDAMCYSGLLQSDQGQYLRIEDGGQKKIGTDEAERTEIEIFYPEVDFGNLFVKKIRKDGR